MPIHGDASTAVYFLFGTGHASLAMRPAVETFAHVALPPPTVTQTASMPIVRQP